MQKPFSIIIATYNCGPKIAATLDSVLAQSPDLYELIVVDGGSTDETLTVLEKYSGQVRLISETDQGVYDAFNKGIALATGRHLYFLGAGDRLRPGTLARIVKQIPVDGPSLIYGDTYYMRQRLVVRGKFSQEDFMVKNLCHQSIFYEREIFEMLGGYDLKYKVYSDWAFNMKCFADNRIRQIYVEVVIADYEEGGISQTIGDAVFHRDLPKLLRRYVGAKPYAKLKLYNSRVALYRFRQKLAHSIKAFAMDPRSRGTGRRSYNVEK